MMKQYLKLLMARESKEVLGKNGSNLWVLTIVLVAIFTSIAFSEGSMNYLKAKMDDPFTLWVNISRQSDDKTTSNDQFNAFLDSLELSENRLLYDYNAVITSQRGRYTIRSKGVSDFLSARFFEQWDTRLMRKVLSEENVIAGCSWSDTRKEWSQELLDNQSMGLVISANAAERLGFKGDDVPAYIHYLALNTGADSLGLRLVDQEYLPVALPVIAVVHRLPNNVQMLAGTFLYAQLENISETDPFDFTSNKQEYLRQLVFYVCEDYQESFDEFVSNILPDSLRLRFSIEEAGDNYQAMKTWKPGTLRQINNGDGQTPLSVYQRLANAIEDKFTDQSEVCRVFALKTKDESIDSRMFLSVEFNSLGHITDFETFADRNNVQLETEQVHTKQNFDSVATMAGILSAAMVVFSIVCIIMFMVNMLQSYFQKVKRNIGTFKAFGMKGRELIEVYVLLLLGIITASIILSLLVTWGIQGLLPFFGVEKEEGFNYLHLWNWKTYVATAVIFISTIATVIVVMTRMLSQTPGDLIYDRG